MINFLNGLKLVLSSTIILSAGVKGQEGTEEGEYIDDLRTVYATSWKEAENQLPEGYELVDTDPIYKGSYTEGSYVAMKRTNDIDEAITDIRAMNMVGGWSTSSYEEVLNTQKTGILNLVNSIVPAIDDFRAKYPGAKQHKASTGNENGVLYAATIFDTIYDDDLVNETDGLPYTLLDIFMEPTLCTTENLIDICLQGNSKLLHTVYQCLMFSATSMNDAGESFNLDNLASYTSEADYIDCDQGELTDTQVDQMVECCKQMKTILSIFHESGFAENPDSFTEEDIMAYKECLTAEEAVNFEASSYIYAYLCEAQYLGDSLINFFVNFDSTDSEFDPECVKPFLLEMNDAQEAVVPYAGLESLFRGMMDEEGTCVDENDNEKPRYNLLTRIIDDNVESLQTNVSVFINVDRRIFQADGIALTSDALRQNNAKDDFSWFVETNDSVALLDQLVYATAIIGGVILGACAGIYYSMKLVFRLAIKGYSYAFSQGTFANCLKFWSEYWTVDFYNKTMTKLATEKAKQVVIKQATREMEEEAAAAFINRMSSKSLIFEPVIDEESLILASRNAVCVISVVNVLFAISTIVLAAALIMYIIRTIISYSTDHIVYEDIPEMMVDEKQVDDEPVYSFYTNLMDFDGNTMDVSKAAERHQSQWVALYYTKDTTCGDPILADSFGFVDDIEDIEDAEGVRKFGEVGAYNLTKYVQQDTIYTYMLYESVDRLALDKEDSVYSLENYARQLMGGQITGYAKTIVNIYTREINDATSTTEVHELLVEAMNELNDEKVENYTPAKEVYDLIAALNKEDADYTTKVSEARTAYDALTDDQKVYVYNIEDLEDEEIYIVEQTFTAAKTSALTDVKTYLLSFGTFNEDELNEIYYQCEIIIHKATTVSEIELAKESCVTYIDKQVQTKKNLSASVFGDGNLGLLFIGLGGGLVIGVAGLWLTLKLLKKKKEEPKA